jgi:hypothetical protein
MKLKAAFSVLILTLISAIAAHAQGLPCGGTDPDATCPLDTWVVVLVVAASLFAAYTLYRRQAALRSDAK